MSHNTEGGKAYPEGAVYGGVMEISFWDPPKGK